MFKAINPKPMRQAKTRLWLVKMLFSEGSLSFFLRVCRYTLVVTKVRAVPRARVSRYMVQMSSSKGSICWPLRWAVTMYSDPAKTWNSTPIIKDATGIPNLTVLLEMLLNVGLYKVQGLAIKQVWIAELAINSRKKRLANTNTIKPTEVLITHPAFEVKDTSVFTTEAITDLRKNDVTTAMFDKSKTVLLAETFDRVYLTIIHVRRP